MNDQLNFQIIKDYIKANSLTVKAFCEKCRISVSTYYKVMRGDNIQLTMLVRIKKGMDIKMKDLFIKT